MFTCPHHKLQKESCQRDTVGDIFLLSEITTPDDTVSTGKVFYHLLFTHSQEHFHFDVLSFHFAPELLSISPHFNNIWLSSIRQLYTTSYHCLIGHAYVTFSLLFDKTTAAKGKSIEEQQFSAERLISEFISRTGETSDFGCSRRKLMFSSSHVSGSMRAYVHLMLRSQERATCLLSMLLFLFPFVNFHLAHFHLSTGTVASPRQVTPLPCPPCTLSVSLPTTTTNCFTVTLYNWLEHVFRTLIHHHRRHSCWKLLTWADYSRWSSWTKSWADLNANRIFFRSHHYF